MSTIYFGPTSCPHWISISLSLVWVLGDTVPITRPYKEEPLANKPRKRSDPEGQELIYIHFFLTDKVVLSSQGQQEIV